MTPPPNFKLVPLHSRFNQPKPLCRGTRGVDNTLVHLEVREFQFEGERFRARMDELAKRAAVREP